MINSAEQIILDFTDQDIATKWEAIDDRIMGGGSRSTPEYVSEIGLRFSGNVSLENDGGFASIRSATGEYNLSQFSGLSLRLRGDGKSYKLSLRTDVFYDGVSYQAEFKTEAGVWQEVELPFNAFLPTHHGLKLSTVAPMDTTNVRSFGLFIAGKQEGPFQLEITKVQGI